MVFMQLSLIITLPCDYLFEVLPIAIFYCHICIIDEVEVVAEWLIILVAYHTHEHLICIGSLSQTYGCDRTCTHCTLPEEGCDVKVDMHCICTFEVHLYWSFMLVWSSGYEEYSFHLYEEYCFIHMWISFIYCIWCSLHVYGNFIR